MPKKPDDRVGRSEGPAAGGGRQTPQQRAITERSGPGGAEEAGGLSDAERNAPHRQAGDQPGPAPVSLGGSSQGQSDRMPAGGASVVNEKATNPAASPGGSHDAV